MARSEWQGPSLHETACGEGACRRSDTVPDYTEGTSRDVVLAGLLKNEAFFAPPAGLL